MKYDTLIIHAIFSLLMISCSLNPPRDKIKGYQRNYQFTDISGDFLLDFESGLSESNEAYVKRRLIGEGDNKEYEKLVAVSKVGSLKTGSNKITTLRPKISQYTVWFEKKKYFSQLEVISSQKILKVRMKSPEKAWNGIKVIPSKNREESFAFLVKLPIA